MMNVKGIVPDKSDFFLIDEEDDKSESSSISLTGEYENLKKSFGSK